MTPDQLLETTASESQRLITIVSDDLDAVVGHVDDWPLRQLVGHVGAVYSMVIANVAAGSADMVRPGPEAEAPDTDQALIAWFGERRQTLLDTLSATDVEASVPTFVGQQPSVWWRRRMASETAVHRWDVDAAINGIDAAAPIESDAAADAVDEYLHVSLQFSSSRPDRIYPAETLHLHRTDGPGEWMLAASDDNTVIVTHEHGKGDAAARGPASDLLLWVWGRPTTSLEIFGDHAVAEAWRELSP